MAEKLGSVLYGRGTSRFYVQIDLVTEKWTRSVLAPSVVEVRGNAFSTTQIRDALFSPKPFEHDADLVFRGELPSASPTDL
jgi:hypothetical protein